MIGAIIGDIVGSVYEWDNIKTKDFVLFRDDSFFTDDTIMTLAVGKAIYDSNKDTEKLKNLIVPILQEIGQPYPKSGYGGNFYDWMYSNNPQPYNSFGNGAAMRVSACGLVADSLDEAKELSRIVTEISHNHPEGIKGAEATTVAIYMARQDASKDEIRKHIEENYYDLNFTLDEIRDTYEFNETCQRTVPQSIMAFLESTDFEDAIRNAISIGGDSDTLAAITGSIAEAYYGVPQKLKDKAMSYLDDRLLYLFEEFNDKFKSYRLDTELLEGAINDILPGLAMYIRDVNLAPKLTAIYEPGMIIMERGFTDASCRVMGMITSHRYSILSNHMVDLREFKHGTNWGLYVANRGSRFKVIDVYEYQNKTQILLLHLPDDRRWKLFEDLEMNIEKNIVVDCRERFKNKCLKNPILELATNLWIDRCKMPLGMSDDGVLFEIE